MRGDGSDAPSFYPGPLLTAMQALLPRALFLAQKEKQLGVLLCSCGLDNPSASAIYNPLFTFVAGRLSTHAKGEGRGFEEGEYHPSEEEEMAIARALSLSQESLSSQEEASQKEQVALAKALSLSNSSQNGSPECENKAPGHKDFTPGLQGEEDAEFQKALERSQVIY